jgi:hypothetical protein
VNPSVYPSNPPSKVSSRPVQRDSCITNNAIRRPVQGNSIGMPGTPSLGRIIPDEQTLFHPCLPANSSNSLLGSREAAKARRHEGTKARRQSEPNRICDPCLGIPSTGPVSQSESSCADVRSDSFSYFASSRLRVRPTPDQEPIERAIPDGPNGSTRQHGESLGWVLSMATQW